MESALPAGERERLMGPLREQVKHLNPNGHTGSVVLLRSAELNEVMYTPEALPAQAIVGDRFPVRALLPLFHDSHEFYLLALSQKRTRLLHCTAASAEEVAFPPGTPTSLGESRHTDKPDHMLDNRSSAGPSVGSMKGVMSGTSTDADEKPEYLANFFGEIDRAVHAIVKESQLPLVLVGVESELAIYRIANTYPHLVETGVSGSPDGLKGGEMHARGLRALSTYVSPGIRKQLGEFDKLIGAGHASVHAPDIVKAAHDGRVSRLYLQSSAEYLGNFDEARSKVSHHAGSGEERHNLIDDAAIQTILHGGQVMLLTGQHMPNGVPVCAVFRY
ncbi:MAG: hypothetical protein M3Z09_05640 [Acidobacteriota bacterium]|nr:hypothetical protein [Acidobacteriota bacterium]